MNNMADIYTWYCETDKIIYILHDKDFLENFLRGGYNYNYTFKYLGDDGIKYPINKGDYRKTDIITFIGGTFYFYTIQTHNYKDCTLEYYDSNNSGWITKNQNRCTIESSTIRSASGGTGTGFLRIDYYNTDEYLFKDCLLYGSECVFALGNKKNTTELLTVQEAMNNSGKVDFDYLFPVNYNNLIKIGDYLQIDGYLIYFKPKYGYARNYKDYQAFVLPDKYTGKAFRNIVHEIDTSSITPFGGLFCFDKIYKDKENNVNFDIKIFRINFATDIDNLLSTDKSKIELHLDNSGLYFKNINNLKAKDLYIYSTVPLYPMASAFNNFDVNNLHIKDYDEDKCEVYLHSDCFNNYNGSSIEASLVFVYDVNDTILSLTSNNIFNNATKLQSISLLFPDVENIYDTTKIAFCGEKAFINTYNLEQLELINADSSSSRTRTTLILQNNDKNKCPIVTNTKLKIQIEPDIKNFPDECVKNTVLTNTSIDFQVGINIGRSAFEDTNLKIINFNSPTNNTDKNIIESDAFTNSELTTINVNNSNGIYYLGTNENREETTYDFLKNNGYFHLNSIYNTPLFNSIIQNVNELKQNCYLDSYMLVAYNENDKKEKEFLERYYEYKFLNNDPIIKEGENVAGIDYSTYNIVKLIGGSGTSYNPTVDDMKKIANNGNNNITQIIFTPEVPFFKIDTLTDLQQIIDMFPKLKSITTTSDNNTLFSTISEGVYVYKRTIEGVAYDIIIILNNNVYNYIEFDPEDRLVYFAIHDNGIKRFIQFQSQVGHLFFSATDSSYNNLFKNNIKQINAPNIAVVASGISQFSYLRYEIDDEEGQIEQAIYILEKSQSTVEKRLYRKNMVNNTLEKISDTTSSKNYDWINNNQYSYQYFCTSKNEDSNFKNINLITSDSENDKKTFTIDTCNSFLYELVEAENDRITIGSIWKFKYDTDNNNVTCTFTNQEYKVNNKYNRFSMEKTKYRNGTFTSIFGDFNESNQYNLFIDLQDKWDKMLENPLPKILKDKNGNMFIIQITSSQFKKESNAWAVNARNKDLLTAKTTLTFNWKECADVQEFLSDNNYISAIPEEVSNYNNEYMQVIEFGDENNGI